MWWRSRTAIPASALALAVLQVGGTFGATSNQPERRDVEVLTVVLLLLGPAALAFRDRHPVVAAAVTMAAADLYFARGYAYGPIFASVAVGLFSAAQRGHRRGTWLVAGLGAIGFVAAGAIDDAHTPDPLDPLHLAVVAGWLVGVLAVAELARSRRAQLEAVARAEAEDRQRRAGEQRLRLAQDLHDVLAHNISLINVQAGVALHLLDERPEQARPALTAITTASRTALHELRAALDLLRDGEAAPRSPAPTLDQLDELVQGVRASGLVVELIEDGTGSEHPAAVQLAAYRIVQEALTNITRHAEARRATVRVHHGDHLVVEVTDDGIGGVAQPGNGLRGMRERATSLGGTLDAGPAAGGGFRVLATLPGGDS